MKPSAPASRALSVGMTCAMDSRGCGCREAIEPFREPTGLNRGADARLSAAEIEFRPSIALTDVSSELTRLSTGFQVHRQLQSYESKRGVRVVGGLR